MQCRITAWQLNRFLVYLLVSFCFCSISAADQHIIPKERFESGIKNDPENIKWYLMAYASQVFASQSEKELEQFVSHLDKLAKEDKYRGYKVDILFLQAETNYNLDNHKKAYEQYLQLQLVADKDSTYVIGIDKKLLALESSIANSEKKSKILKLFPKRDTETQTDGEDAPEETVDSENKSVEIIYYSVFLIISVILFYLFRPIPRKFDMKELEEEHPLKAKLVYKLIDREKMRQNDGRVSERSVSAFADLDEEKRNELMKEKGAYCYAGLLVKGHEMIKKLNNYAPYPVALLTPEGKGLTPFWSYTIFAVIFCSVWALGLTDWMSGFVQSGDKLNQYTLLMIAIMIIASLTAVRLVAIQTINSLDEMISMLEPVQPADKGDESTLEKLGKWIRFLFRSFWQFYIVAIILGIVVIRDMILTNNISFWDLIFIFLLLLVVSPLLWIIFGSLILTNRICAIEDLEVNPLSPLKTMGLKKWMSVIGTYNIMAGIVLTFGCFIPVVNGYIINSGTGNDDWFWFAGIIPLLLFYWLYPYIKMRGLINSIKVRRMQFLKAKIAHIFNMWTEKEEYLLKKEEEIFSKGIDKEARLNELIESRKKGFGEMKPQLELMESYYSMFQRIDESPESYIDFNSVLQLAKAMGLPTVFAILSALFLK